MARRSAGPFITIHEVRPERRAEASTSAPIASCNYTHSRQLIKAVSLSFPRSCVGTHVRPLRGSSLPQLRRDAERRKPLVPTRSVGTRGFLSCLLTEIL